MVPGNGRTGGGVSEFEYSRWGAVVVQWCSDRYEPQDITFLGGGERQPLL
jgi:hypothetical protein